MTYFGFNRSVGRLCWGVAINNSLHDASRSNGNVTPAAISCPPNWVNTPSHASKARTSENPGMLRPLPFPIPSSSKPITIVGRWKCRTNRDATIPTTPGCQPREPTTIAADKGSDRSERRANASSIVACSTACRSRFCRSSDYASRSASDASSVNKRSSAS
jgi:hypothetical protein